MLRLFILGLSSTLAALSFGCDSWPRYAQVGEDTAALWPAGSSPHSEWVWTEGSALQEDPGTPMVLSPGQGFFWEGDLRGTGLDPSGSAPSQDTGCELNSDFPPLERGAYLGQSLWASLAFQELGTLCAAAFSADASLDLLLYDLSLCGIPQGPVQDPETGASLGYNNGADPAWSTLVVDGPILGVVLSGYEPDDSTWMASYQMALSLVERNGDGLGTCPPPPWEEP